MAIRRIFEDAHDTELATKLIEIYKRARPQEDPDFNRLIRRAYVAFGAYEGENCIGAILINQRKKRSSVSYSISEIFVDPNHQKKGAGTDLLERGICFIKDTDLSPNILVSAYVMPAAQKLFEDADFKRDELEEDDLSYILEIQQS